MKKKYSYTKEQEETILTNTTFIVVMLVISMFGIFAMAFPIITIALVAVVLIFLGLWQLYKTVRVINHRRMVAKQDDNIED